MSLIFISYAKEDSATARRLWVDLKSAGFQPWIDSEEILPGQNWPAAIKAAIGSASRCIVLLSRNSVTKRGYVQAEIRFALNQLSLHPPNSVFIIPVRLDDVIPTHDQLRELQWLDLFPSYEIAFERLLITLGERERQGPAAADLHADEQAQQDDDSLHSDSLSSDAERVAYNELPGPELQAPVDSTVMLRDVEVTLLRLCGVVVQARDLPMGQVLISLKVATGDIEELTFAYSGFGISRGDYLEILCGNSLRSSGAVPLFLLNRSTGESCDLLKTSVALYKLGVNDSLSTTFFSLVAVGVGFILSMASLTALMDATNLPPDFISVSLVIGPLLGPAAVGLFFAARKQFEMNAVGVQFDRFVLESASSFWSQER